VTKYSVQDLHFIFKYQKSRKLVLEYSGGPRETSSRVYTGT